MTDTASTRVLFLCTGNSARSQMAEALLRHRGGDRFEVHSAGLEPKGMNPYTVRVMDEIDIDVRGQRSKSLTEYLGSTSFDYVITVCGHADENCPLPLWQGGEKLYWPFDDPAAAIGGEADVVAAFRRTRDLIDAEVRSWVAGQADNGGAG